MKQILVVCVGIPTGESITAELNTIFRGVARAEFCLCHQLREKAEGRDIVLFSSKYSQALCGGTALSPTAFPAQRVINYRNLQEVIELEAGSRVLLVNDDKDTAAEAIGLGNRTNSVLQAAFFKLSGVLPVDQAVDYMKAAIQKTYGRKGDKVVQMNCAAVDAGLTGLHEIAVPAAWANLPDEPV